MEKTMGLLKNNWQWMSLLGAILGVGMTVGIWFDSYTKDFCNKLLEKAEYNLSMADEESVFILEGSD